MEEEGAIISPDVQVNHSVNSVPDTSLSGMRSTGTQLDGSIFCSNCGIERYPSKRGVDVHADEPSSKRMAGATIYLDMGENRRVAFNRSHAISTMERFLTYLKSLPEPSNHTKDSVVPLSSPTHTLRVDDQEEDVPTTDSSALDGPRPPVDKHSEIVQVRSFVSIAHVNDLTMMKNLQNGIVRKNVRKKARPTAS